MPVFFSDNDLAILAKRSVIVPEDVPMQPLRNVEVIRDTGIRANSVRHTLYTFYPYQQFTNKEFAFLGNRLTVLNRHIPYSASGQSLRPAWVSFDETQQASAVQYLGGSAIDVLVDSNIVLLTGGTKITRSFERFRLSFPTTPLVVGTTVFAQSRFHARQSTLIQILASADMDIDIARAESSTDGFTVGFTGAIGAAGSDQFDLIVPMPLSQAHLEVCLTANEVLATCELQRELLDGTFTSEVILNFPINVNSAQQDYVTDLHHTNRYRVIFTGGGAAEDGTYVVLLTWKPQEDHS